MSALRDSVTLWILFAGLMVRIVASALIPPTFDEAYYGVYSLNLDWGYYDHPPAVAIVAGLGRWITGSYSYLSLRFGALLLFMFTCMGMYEITRLLYGSSAARMSVALLHVTPLFFLGLGAIVLPDITLGLFWLLFLYSLMKLRANENHKWLLLSGLSLGFALLSKYHAVLLLAGIGWCLAFFREWRRYWKSPYLYLGFVVVLIVISPNIYWNYRNDWISFTLQFGKGVSGTSISVLKFLQSALSPIVYILPWHFFVLAAAMVKGVKKYLWEIRWLLPFCVIPIAVFVVIGGTRQILPHWPMPGYLTAVILASGWLSKLDAVKVKRYFLYTSIFTTAVVVILIAQAQTGIIPLDRKADLTLDGLGWDTVIETLEQRGLLDESVFLFSHKWFTAGELAYAAQTRYLTTVLPPQSAHSFSLWTDTRELIGRDGIFVTTERYPADVRGRYNSYFQEIAELPQITMFRASQEAQIFHVWLCRKFSGPPLPNSSKLGT